LIQKARPHDSIIAGQPPSAEFCNTITQKADIRQDVRNVADVPILLQNSD
jgi:hypothetical protein